MYYTILQELQEEKHFHPDMEAVYVVMGKIRVTIMDTEYILGKRDVLVINSGLEHRIRGEKGSIICQAYYPRMELSRLSDRPEGLFFICNSALYHERSYAKIRGIFREMILEYMKPEAFNPCMERSLLYKLLACLMDEYASQDEEGEGAIAGENLRLRKMIQYILQNFTDNISLSVLAEKMYTSPSTLSRFFKKQTGIYFADYVNQMRLRYAVQGLLYTEDSITKIAVDSGYSNLSVFNRLFKQAYGMTPNEYRKKLKHIPLQTEVRTEEIREKLKEEFGEQEEEQRIHAVAEITEGREYKNTWGRAINVGSVHNLLLANTQYHTLYLTENLGFRYVRLWNIFSMQMMMTDGKDPEHFNYDQTDIVFDFLIEHKIIPFLDFGIRPKTAVYNVDKYVYYGNESVEFQSQKVWEQAVISFIRHMISRYGHENVSRWIFEMSYDTKHKTPFYLSNNPSYFGAYRFFYQTIRSMLPEARVGGPMAITPGEEHFLRDFLRMSRKEKCLPDFVSILLFPYVSERETEGLTFGETKNDSYEVDEIDKLQRLMKEEGIDCPIYVSEWNYTISSRSWLNDSCFRASYFTDRIVRLLDKVDMLMIWMGSDWVSNYFDVRGVAAGGNGLLTKDTICKPAYYAIQFLNTLGERLLQKEEHYVLTRKGKRDYYLLLFNHTPLEGDFLFYESRMQDPGQMDMIYEGQRPMQMQITLRGMKKGRYVIKKRTITPKEGSLLFEWSKFDFDNALTSPEVKYIRQICFPRISLKKQETEDDRLVIQEEVGRHEIVLIHIYEEDTI